MTVIFIGINDIWWRKLTAEDFETGLWHLVKTARLRNLISVLATIMPRGELPAVVNPDDTKIGTYCRITPTVAAETGRSLVDLRTGDLACICNENPELQFDGALVSKSKGVLTTDGVHSAERGIR